MPLPPGLLLNRETGELTGVPTVAGTYAIQLKVRDVLGSERELTDTVVINAYTPLSWSGTMGFLMATRAATGITVTRSGGLAAFVYTIFSGALPDGLSLNAGSGAITGTPTTPGGYAFTLRVTDSLAQIRDYVLAGTITANLTLSYNAAALTGTVGVAINQSPTVAGGATPYTYTVQSGTLPPGLTLNAGTGVISGTPTDPAQSGTVTIRVTDAQGFITDATALTKDIAAFPVVSGTFLRGMVGKAYSRTFTGSGGHTAYVWGVVNPPTSVTMSSGTGELSGTPSVAGMYATIVRLTDNLGVIAELAGSVEIAPALSISGSYNASPTLGQSYSFLPNVVGGYPPYAYDISAGSLPAGLALNPTTGLISGVIAAEANYTATLRVTDADGSTATMAFNVNSAGVPDMAGGVPALGTTTVAFTGDNLSVSGGVAPYSWSVVVGALPNGLSLNTGTGDITGTPTVAGTFNYTIRVTDANQLHDQTAFTTTVAVFPTLNGDLPDGTNGVAYSAQLSRAGGHSPFTFDISVGALPSGLTINGANGTVSGTPDTTASSSFTVRVTDNAGNVATKADAIQIYDPPLISGTINNVAEVTDPYSDTALSASGGKPSLAWSVQGTLPPGLSLNGSNGDITGTPTTAGDYTFTVRVTDALGRTSSSAQTINVHAAVVLTSPGHENDATDTAAYSSTQGASGGWTPYTFSIVSGSLPPGLTLTAASGLLSGTPTTPGNYVYTIRVTDNLGVLYQWVNTITVSPAVDLTGTAPKGTIGVGYSFTPTRTGGVVPFTFSVVSGSLPAGTSLNASTGTISGVISGSPTTYSPTIRVTEANGDTDDLALSIVVAAKPTLTLNYGHGTVGVAYSGTVSTTGGHAPLSFAVVSGAVPFGLSLNSSTGALTGTPTTSGTANFTIRVTDAMGNIKDTAGSITIAAALTINGSYGNGTQNQTYSSSISASGGWTPRTFSLFSGSLPNGLALSGSTGALTGTPTVANTFNFTIRVTDNDGNTFNKAMSVVIAASTPLNAVANPNPTSAYDTAFVGTPVTVSATSTVTAAGGVAPYTYTWSFISAAGSAGAMTITHPTQNKINGSRTSTLYDRSEVWRCTVRDAVNTLDTVDVTIHLVIERDPFGL